MRIVKIFLLTTILMYACKKDGPNTSENGPSINIISPTSEDMPATGSTVLVNATISDEDEIHDITINITSDHSSEPASIDMFFDHIHNTEFNIDTSFIADIPTGTMANYTIIITAEDMLGNANSESVTFHVMD